MSILSVALPAASALPVFQAAATNAVRATRSFLRLAMLIFSGLVSRTGWLFNGGAYTMEERMAHRNLRSATVLNNMARDLDSYYPTLAAELRLMAGNEK